MRRTPIIPIEWVPDDHDSDWDGVPNYRDCEPFNPRKQDNENITIVKRYLLKVVKNKDKKALKEVRQFTKTLNKKEKMKIAIDPEIEELTYILDRKILPKMEPSHVSFGPFDKKVLKYFNKYV